MGVTTEHVCVMNEHGYCDDVNRDWCNWCQVCTVWHGEFCSVCGLEWGSEHGTSDFH